MQAFRVKFPQYIDQGEEDGDICPHVWHFMLPHHPGAGSLRLAQKGNKVWFTLDSLRSKRSMAASLIDISGLFAFKQLFQWLTGGRATTTLVGIGPISNTDIPRQTAALISAAVNQARPIPSQIQVARALGYPLSTYRRRLSQQNTSFRKIRDDCLMQCSQELLLRDGSIAQIALRLGFQDSDTFRSAFRRWTGIAPTIWRETETGK